jgi:hypothetical protein
LRTFTRKHFPNQPNRVEDLLVRLPEVSTPQLVTVPHRVTKKPLFSRSRLPPLSC